MTTPQEPRQGEIAWSLYDVANSAFATTVMAAFFPVFLKEYWAKDVPATESTFWLGVTSSSAAMVALVLCPILGSISDAGKLKKPLLAACAGAANAPRARNSARKRAGTVLRVFDIALRLAHGFAFKGLCFSRREERSNQN